MDLKEHPSTRNNEWSSAFRTAVKITLVVAPFLIGLKGFLIYIKNPTTDDILEAAYRSLNFYVLNSEESVINNWMLQLARWTAPIVTASGILLILQRIRILVHNNAAYIRGGAVAVYGEGPDADMIREQLSRRAVQDEDSFVRADKYVLAGDQDTNIKLWNQFKDRIGDKPVFIKDDGLLGRMLTGNVYTFDPAENAARQYWKERCLYSLSKENGHQISVCLVNFGTLGKALLLSGLLQNIFDPGQRITYHVFDGANEFRNLYHELSQMTDEIHFYPDGWFSHLQIIKDAHRVIVCEDMSLLSKLLFAVPGIPVDVLSGTGRINSFFDDKNRITLFDWRSRSMRLEHIFQDTLIRNAKKINMRYERIYSGGSVEETEENMERLWGRLDGFTRYSNISAADYHEIQRIMLQEDGMTVEDMEKDQEYLEKLAELEHIRWCRYHYLNNWKRGSAPEGKKDMIRRLHPLLVEYSELDPLNRSKDRSNLIELFGLDL